MNNNLNLTNNVDYLFLLINLCLDSEYLQSIRLAVRIYKNFGKHADVQQRPPTLTATILNKNEKS